MSGAYIYLRDIFLFLTITYNNTTILRLINYDALIFHQFINIRWFRPKLSNADVI